MPVHLFDISSTLTGKPSLQAYDKTSLVSRLTPTGPSRSWSPFTLRARMVLNYKQIPYTQTYIPYPDIAGTLTSLGVTPNETGMAYTFPAIVHRNHPSIANPNGALMDSFAIATHLNHTFPSPALFPSEASYPLALAVDRLVYAVISKGLVLAIPPVTEILDARSRAYFVETRSAFFGKPLADVRPKEPSEVQKITEDMKAEMEPLARMLRGETPEKKNGPFFEGAKPGYADFVVVSFLGWLERVDRVLWAELSGVGEGEFRTLCEACAPWVEGQGVDIEWGSRAS
jgi:glutathione S-transferase